MVNTTFQAKTGEDGMERDSSDSPPLFYACGKRGVDGFIGAAIISGASGLILAESPSP